MYRVKTYDMQVALWVEQSRFLVNPDNHNAKEFEVLEPEVAICKPTSLEAAESCKGAIGKGKGRKRTAKAPAVKKPRGINK